MVARAMCPTFKSEHEIGQITLLVPWYADTFLTSTTAMTKYLFESLRLSYKKSKDKKPTQNRGGTCISHIIDLATPRRRTHATTDSVFCVHVYVFLLMDTNRHHRSSVNV